MHSSIPHGSQSAQTLHCITLQLALYLMQICDCLFSPLLPVLAELQQADLITSEECEGMVYPSHVVRVQSGKSDEVMGKSAVVLKRHGFEKESRLLAGKQTYSSAC